MVPGSDPPSGSESSKSRVEEIAAITDEDLCRVKHMEITNDSSADFMQSEMTTNVPAPMEVDEDFYLPDHGNLEANNEGQKATMGHDGNRGGQDVVMDVPVHVPKLLGLLEKTYTVGESIDGKDILLLIGQTGSGKTTTLLYLSGAKFEEKDHNGFDHYEPVEKSDFATSSGSSSVTKTIQAKTIRLKSNKDVVICDTPGFEDTEGVEVEIANSCGLIRALRRARSVKPILVLNAETMSDRFISVKRTFDTVLRMMKTDSINFQAFEYIFTRCNLKVAKRIHQRLSSCCEVDRTGEHALYPAFIADIVGKTQPSAYFFDPLDSEYAPVLLEGLLRSGKTISNPNEHFNSFLPEVASQKLAWQLELTKKSIQDNIHCCCFAEAANDFDLLGGLMKVLPNETKSHFEACKGMISSFLSDRKKEIKEKTRVMCLLSEQDRDSFYSEAVVLAELVEKARSAETIASKIYALHRDAEYCFDIGSFACRSTGLSFDWAVSIEEVLSQIDALKWSIVRLKVLLDVFANPEHFHTLSTIANRVIDRLSTALEQSLEAVLGQFQPSIHVELDNAWHYISLGLDLADLLYNEGFISCRKEIAYYDTTEQVFKLLKHHTSSTMANLADATRSLEIQNCSPFHDVKVPDFSEIDRHRRYLLSHAHKHRLNLAIDVHEVHIRDIIKQHDHT
eukprot:scaffold14619_cov146-Amphora_coffeaeformis.AAC.2